MARVYPSSLRLAAPAEILSARVLCGIFELCKVSSTQRSEEVCVWHQPDKEEVWKAFAFSFKDNEAYF